MTSLLTLVISFVKEKVPWFSLKSDRGRRCQECNGVIPHHEGGEQLVCSDRCLHNLWIGAHESYAIKTGRKICSLPGCGKECCREGDRLHDYCCRSHSREHMLQLNELYGNTIEIKRCKLPDCKKFCFVDDFGRIYDYCCKTHSERYWQMTPITDHTNGGPVLFYNEYDLFYEFTNFYKFAPFEIDGKEWRSTEHYFQAQKFVGTPYEEYVRLHAATPREAFQFARDAESLKWQRSDWDHIKLSVMYKALLAKFTEHEQLRQLLLSTGDRRLVEHTFNDSFWGDGGDGSGLNHLGKLLEKVRGLLKETKYSTSQSGK